MRFSSHLGLAALALWPTATAWAQGNPGTNLQVEVKVTGVFRSKDTTYVSYILTNMTGSAEVLQTYTVNAPVLPLGVLAPSPVDAWATRTRYRGRTVARWTALDGIQPGQSSPTLTFKAVGLPALVQSWYRGDKLPSTFEDDTLAPHPDEFPQGDVDPLVAYSVPTPTVGVEPAPAAPSRPILATRVRDQAGTACGLGWITSASLCDDLESYLAGSTLRILDHLAAVSAGHTSGGPVNDNAYWLLTASGEAARDFIDVPGIRLTYICGNRFRLRNPNYASIQVTYDVYRTSESSSLLLPGRTADQQPYTESFFTTTNRGTVRVFFNGQLIQTKANGGTTCP